MIYPKRTALIFRDITALWLVLMVLFTLGRLHYLFDYRQLLRHSEFTSLDLLHSLISALRFDSFVSAAFCLPLVLLGPVLGLLQSRKFTRTVILGVGITAIFLSWLVVVGDHFFFVYFRDHFNVFFWEIWENLANAALVAGGVNQEIPLVLSLSILITGIAIGSFALIRLTRPQTLPRWMPTPERGLGRFFIVWIVLYAVAFRATLSPLPLTLQDRRIMLSVNPLINLLHTNPFIPLYRSYADFNDLNGSRISENLSTDQMLPAFQLLSTQIPGAKVAGSPDTYYRLEQEILPGWSKILDRKPKHIVLIFMESYSKWPSKFNEDGFSDRISANYKTIEDNSLSFEQHFPSSAGTIKNITHAIYSISTPRAFKPSLNYHPEAYKRFSQLLPKTMEKLGFESSFYYGGVSHWHRLYHFLPEIGFHNFFSENSFPDKDRHPYGLYDRDLFKSVHERLEKTDRPTFSFVMSLTNHPPYNVPTGEDDKTWKIPETLKKWLIVEEDFFYQRFNAFAHSDRALGQFMKWAESAPYGKDTVFVITGDHGFGGTFLYPPQQGWLEDLIPLVIYAPGLMKKEFIGKKIETFSTHLDLLPTLVSLASDKPTTLTTWGKNLLLAPEVPYTGFNHYFSCLNRKCIRQGQVYNLAEDLLFRPAPDDTEVRKKIEDIDNAYSTTGIHYLQKF